MKDIIEKRLLELKNHSEQNADQESQISKALKQTRNIGVSLKGGILELEHILEELAKDDSAPVEPDKPGPPPSTGITLTKDDVVEPKKKKKKKGK